jgi:hypothetical protein
MAKAKEAKEVKQEPSTSLVALNSQFMAVFTQILEAGGELTPESEDALVQTELALCEKTDGYGIVLEQLQNRLDFWEYQTKKCADVKRAIDNAITRLKDRMKFVLSQRPEGEQQLQGELYRFFLADAADKIEVDEHLLPDQFKKTFIDVTPDREKIKAALAAGEKILGVRVTPNKSLRQGKPK